MKTSGSLFQFTGVSILIFLAAGSQQARLAAESSSDPSKTIKFINNINIVSILGGARFVPEQIPAGPKESARTVSSADAELAGIFVQPGITGIRGGAFLFRGAMDLAVLAGRRRLSLETDAARTQSDKEEAVTFLPGEVYTELLFFLSKDDILALRIGKKNQNSSLEKAMAFSHGVPPGLFLQYSGGAFGVFELSPFYSPALGRSYFSLKGSQTDSCGLHYGGHRLSEDLQASRELTGSGIHYDFSWKILRLRAGYAYHSQKETSSPSPGKDRDFIEYTEFSAGLEYRNQDFYTGFYIAGERSYGKYKTVLRNDTGTTAARIEGSALSAGAVVQNGVFFLGADFFLPESASKNNTSTAGRKAKSGYVGYAEGILDSPMLAGALNARPFPRLCPDREMCSGLIIDRGMPNYSSHAAVLQIRTGYSRGWMISGQIAFFKPLAERTDTSVNPFARLRRDPENIEYREFSFEFGRDFPGNGKILMNYSRLYREAPAVSGRRFAGESIYLMMRINL